MFIKKLVKVYSIQDEHPYEVAAIDNGALDWVDVQFSTDQEFVQDSEIEDEYVVIIRERRWYDRFSSELK